MRRLAAAFGVVRCAPPNVPPRSGAGLVVDNGQLPPRRAAIVIDLVSPPARPTMRGAMKKTFPLQVSGKDDARVRDKIRQTVNQYVRRELRKTVPEGFGRWEFTCRVGSTSAEAQLRALKEVAGAIDTVAQMGAAQVYVEIVAAPARPKSVE